MIKNKKQIANYCGSFILPMLVVMAVFTLLQLAPFGSKNLLVSDLGSQYLPFLSSFKRFFTEGGESLYSFANGIGGPMEPLVAYYLMSPLNIISLFFSYEQLPEVIVGLIIFKIGLMGVTMFTYLDRHYHETTIFTQVFSLAYSLCGFIVVYLLNFMWLDVLVLFPLLVLGLEKMWLKKQPYLYAITLFLSIVFNYYLSYMVCIFSVAYSVYLYYLHIYKKEKSFSLRRLIRQWRLFIVTSLLSGLMTSFLLIPAIFGMLKTGKSTFYLSDFLPIPRFGLEALSQMGMGTLNYNMRLDHLPMIYSGVIIWLLAFVYFFLPTVSKVKKKAMGGLLLFIYFSFLLEGFNTIWHMFQSPAGFPYRNAFIFSFLLIKLAYETYLYVKNHHEAQLLQKYLIWGGMTYLVLLSLGQYFLNYPRNETYLTSNLPFVITIGLILVSLFSLLMIFGKRKRKWLVFLILLTSVELGANLWLSMKDIPFGNQQEFAEMYQEQQALFETLPDKKREFYRINYQPSKSYRGYAEKNNGYNNPLLFGYAGVSSYTSTLDSNVQDVLVNLGMYSKNERRFSYVDESAVANLMLNVKYTVTNKNLPLKTKIKEEKGMAVYQNEEAVGAGFLTNEHFRLVTFEDGDVLVNQERILQGIKSSQTPYFAPILQSKTQKVLNEVTLTGVTKTEGPVYLYLPDVQWKDVSEVLINHQPIRSDLLIVTNQLFNLGSYRQGTPLEIRLKTTKPIEVTNQYWASLDQEKFSEVLDFTKKKSFQLEKGKRGSWQGKLTVEDKTSFLYLGIPYDENWLLKVDGQVQKLERVLDDFSGIKLAKGTHKIELNYISKSFQLGLILTFMSFLVTSVIVVWRYKRKKNKS